MRVTSWRPILLAATPEFGSPASHLIAMPASHALEYEEEDSNDDLFGSDLEQPGPSTHNLPNTLASSSRNPHPSTVSYRPITSTSIGLIPRSGPQQRIEQLRESTRPVSEFTTGRGVISLKSSCMTGSSILHITYSDDCLLDFAPSYKTKCS
jgi:hypothetical protein